METPQLAPPNVLDAVRIGRGDMGYQPAPAERPCEARPGSREKLETLAARIANGEELWHEDDNVGEDES